MPEIKEPSAERVDSLEKFRAWLRVLTEDKSEEGNWGMEDGKYLKLFDGPPNEENFWLWRELGRRELDPEDVRVHFDAETWLHFNHFCRVSNADQDLMSYFPDAEKGKRDIRINVKVGRYLTKYYGETLTEAQIRELANKHREKWSEQQVHFATTEEEIVEVYTFGPKSCVGGLRDDSSKSYKDDSFFTSGKHPARVYASPDLALAYMKRDGKPTARALCNVVKKQYVRLYGDTVLSSKLDQAGFKLSGTALLDAKMKKILHRSGDGTFVVAPYFDGDCHNFNVYDDHIMVESGGMYQGVQQGIVKMIVTITCAYQNHQVREEQAIITRDGPVCKQCLSAHYVTALAPRDRAYTNTYIRAENAASSGYMGNRFDKTADWSGTDYTVINRQLTHKQDVVTTISGAQAHRNNVFACGLAEDGETEVYASLSDVALDWTVYARKDNPFFLRQMNSPAAVKQLRKPTSATYVGMTLGEWLVGYCENQGWPGTKGTFGDNWLLPFGELITRPSTPESKERMRVLYLEARKKHFASGDQNEIPQAA